VATYLLKDISGDLLKKFKIACINKDKTMKQRLMELMEIDVKQSIKKESEQ